MAMDSGARVMNGTWGQIWEDGTEIAEVSAFQVKVNKNFDTINICGQMAEDRKLTGVKITGSMTLHKVYSRGADDVEQAMSGHDLRKTLVGKLDDPDAYGAERVAVYGVSYDEQVLMDWEAGKAGSMTIFLPGHQRGVPGQGGGVSLWTKSPL